MQTIFAPLLFLDIKKYQEVAFRNWFNNKMQFIFLPNNIIIISSINAATEKNHVESWLRICL